MADNFDIIKVLTTGTKKISGDNPKGAKTMEQIINIGEAFLTPPNEKGNEPPNLIQPINRVTYPKDPVSEYFNNDSGSWFKPIDVYEPGNKFKPDDAYFNIQPINVVKMPETIMDEINKEPVEGENSEKSLKELVAILIELISGNKAPTEGKEPVEDKEPKIELVDILKDFIKKLSPEKEKPIEVAEKPVEKEEPKTGVVDIIKDSIGTILKPDETEKPDKKEEPVEVAEKPVEKEEPVEEKPADEGGEEVIV